MLKKKTTFLSLCLIIVLGACQSSQEPVNSPSPNEKKNNKAEVEMVNLIDAPEQKISASQAAVHQYEFVYTNKKKLLPSQSSLVNEVRLGDNSLVILNTQKYDRNFVVFDYKNIDGRWNIQNIVTLDVLDGEYFKNKEKLNLPFNEFVVAKYTDNNPKLWTFANKEKIVTIAKHDRFTFQDQQAQKKTVGDKELYVHTKEKNSYVYYFDSESVILLSGNLNEEDLIELAASLPSANESSFPTKAQ
ncbi:DUF4367 domain-containing protein [Fictibacillus sp. JL2B1089]|uniref:DUF4367 domain-containing protein n=1 Tax=Fictibacillus sp. JL2B1089 TaxID=3399565 RepID=UPI003A872150